MITDIEQKLLHPAKLELLKLIASVGQVKVFPHYSDDEPGELTYENGQVEATGASADVYLNRRCDFGETITVAVEDLSFLDLCQLAEAAAKALAKTPAGRWSTMEVRDLPLDVRLSNVLLCAGIRTVGQLVSQSRKSLLKVDNLGLKSVYEIKEMLAKKGLSLQPN